MGTFSERIRRRNIRARLVDQIVRQEADHGRLIAAGFKAMLAVTYPKGVTAEQYEHLRMAFYGGAQHLFGSIMGFLDGGTEPTERDMIRMDLIDSELKAFLQASLK